MVEIKNVIKDFSKDVRALDDVSITVEDGDIFGIIGLSGAGKSTLIRCINGLETVTSGEILIDKVNVSSLKKKELESLRKEIGMIFQNFNLFSAKTVYDNVAFSLRIQNVDEKEIEKRVKEMLSLVEISNKINSYPGELSGGQKQRVAIARALISHPKILLLDEATSALDPKTSNTILNLIKDLKQKLNFTVILITHDMDVVKKICNKVAILEHGKLIDSGDIYDVFTKILLNTKYYYEEHKNQTTLNLFFSDETVKVSIVSDLIRELNIEVNILAGNIEYINNRAMGVLSIEVDKSNLDKVKKYLDNKGVIVREE